MKNLILVLLSLFLLASCANTQVRENCKLYDWQNLGVQTGSQGFAQPANADIAKMRTCNENGVAPDKQAYISGLTLGLKKYCTPESAKLYGQKGQAFKFESCITDGASNQLNTAHSAGVAEYCSTSGYQAGLSGLALQVQCPESTKAVFNSEFQRGRTEFLTQSMSNMKAQLNRVNQQLESLKDENQNLKNQNNSLDRQNRELKESLDNLEAQVRRGR